MTSELATAGFEINTDASLIEPDWEVFAAEHDRRYGLAISYLKSRVQGDSYDNQVMELRVGRQGFYAQSRRFPAAFFGDTTAPARSFITEEEAEGVAWEAMALYRSGEAQSLTCVYSAQDPPDVFFGYRVVRQQHYEFGMLRPALPLHLRVIVDAGEPFDPLGSESGVLIYQRTSAGDHLLLQAPGRRQPFQARGEGIG